MSRLPRYRKKQSGFTMIELIVAMSIIAISLLGTISAINVAGKSSADPMVTFQGIAIAESYLTEISSKDFPSGPCPPASSRATFSNICNYFNFPQQTISVHSNVTF